MASRKGRHSTFREGIPLHQCSLQAPLDYLATIPEHKGQDPLWGPYESDVVTFDAAEVETDDDGLPSLVSRGGVLNVMSLMAAETATTRIVGPWSEKAFRNKAIRGLSPSIHVRPFNYGGQYWLEIWPKGWPVGKPIHRAPLPAIGTLPPLVYLPSPNESRREVPVTGIVIHETEGGYNGSVSWLRQTRAKASAHLCLDVDGGHCTQLVPYSRKAWHAVNANGYTIGIELVGYTAKPNDPIQLKNAARIVASIAAMYGIPIVFQQLGKGGITTHRALGAYGGNHGDPGGFDFDAFIEEVRAQSRRKPKPYGIK